jgi:hypothetical protein
MGYHFQTTQPKGIIMETLKSVLMRIMAVIAAEALGVIGAGSLVGIEVWQAGVLAGALGAARVLEALARFYLADGNLSAEEINEAFAKVDKKASAE